MNKEEFDYRLRLFNYLNRAVPGYTREARQYVFGPTVGGSIRFDTLEEAYQDYRIWLTY